MCKSNHESNNEFDLDARFGACPYCGKDDGYMNVGSNHWLVCITHKAKWCAGSNLFSDWKWETDTEWKKNAKYLEQFTEVDCIHSSSDIWSIRARRVIHKEIITVSSIEVTHQSPPYLSLRQAAEYFGVSERTIFNWRRDGFPVAEVRGGRLVPRDQAEAWVNQHVFVEENRRMP